MTALFVTATGTEVGKTFVTAGLIGARRRVGLPVAALKPIASGFDENAPETSDSAALLHALGRPITAATIDAVSPWRFSRPLSPDMAATLENRTIDFGAVLEFCRMGLGEARGVTIIEGIGGVMVPLGSGRTVLDLVDALRAPVLLVSPTGLGALSHLLTALAALKARGLAPGAIVLNETPGATVPLDLTLATLRDFCDRETLFPLRRGLDPAPTFDAILATLVGA